MWISYLKSEEVVWIYCVTTFVRNFWETALFGGQFLQPMFMKVLWISIDNHRFKYICQFLDTKLWEKLTESLHLPKMHNTYCNYLISWIYSSRRYLKAPCWSIQISFINELQINSRSKVSNLRVLIISKSSETQIKYKQGCSIWYLLKW